MLLNSIYGSFTGIFYVLIVLTFSLGAFSLLGMELWMGLLQGSCGWDAGGGEFAFTTSHQAIPVVYQPTPCALNCTSQAGGTTFCFATMYGDACPAKLRPLPDSTVDHHLPQLSIQQLQCVAGPNPGYGYTGFDNFGMAFFNAATISTQEGWSSTMYALFSTWGAPHVVFVLFFLHIMLTAGLMELTLAEMFSSYYRALTLEKDWGETLCKGVQERQLGDRSKGETPLFSRSLAPWARPRRLSSIVDVSGIEKVLKEIELERKEEGGGVLRKTSSIRQTRALNSSTEFSGFLKPLSPFFASISQYFVWVVETAEIFPPNLICFVKALLAHPVTVALTYITLLANAVVLGWGLPRGSDDTANTVFVLLFLLEALIKHIGYGAWGVAGGFGYWRRTETVFEGVLCASGVVELFYSLSLSSPSDDETTITSSALYSSAVSEGKAPSYALSKCIGSLTHSYTHPLPLYCTHAQGEFPLVRALRVVRMLRLVYLLRLYPKAWYLVKSLWDRAVRVLSATLLFLLSLLFFALWGGQLFHPETYAQGGLKEGYTPPFSFSSLKLGILAAFQVVDRENWDDISKWHMAVFGSHAALFFLVCQAVGGFLFLNVLVSIILEALMCSDLTDSLSLQKEEEPGGVWGRGQENCHCKREEGEKIKGGGGGGGGNAWNVGCRRICEGVVNRLAILGGTESEVNNSSPETQSHPLPTFVTSKDSAFSAISSANEIVSDTHPSPPIPRKVAGVGGGAGTGVAIMQTKYNGQVGKVILAMFDKKKSENIIVEVTQQGGRILPDLPTSASVMGSLFFKR